MSALNHLESPSGGVKVAAAAPASRARTRISFAVLILGLLGLPAHAVYGQNVQPPFPTFTVPGAVQPTAPPAPDPAPAINVLPKFGSGIASDDDVQNAVGDVTYSMDKCASGAFMTDNRVVRVQLSVGAFEANGVLNALLLGAAKYAWANCPRPVPVVGTNQFTGQFYYNIGEVDVYLPDHTLAYHAALGDYGLKGDRALGPGTDYEWGRDENLVDTHRAQADAAEAQAAQAQAVASQQAANEAAAAQAAQAQALAAKQTGATFWGVVRLVLLAALGLWLWSVRVPILRFWYGLTPHPVSDEVNGAIYSGQTYDPDRLATQLSVMPENAIEREVRARQARELLERLMAHNQRTKAELEEETEFLKGQAGLAEGMETHARIKRLLDAMLRAQGKTA